MNWVRTESSVFVKLSRALSGVTQCLRPVGALSYESKKLIDESIEEIRQAMFGLDGYQGTADVSTVKIREILNKIIKLKLMITTTKNMPVSDLKVTLGILKTQRNNFLNLLQVDMFELQN